jgi:hypothetical protein
MTLKISQKSLYKLAKSLRESLIEVLLKLVLIRVSEFAKVKNLDVLLELRVPIFD